MQQTQCTCSLLVSVLPTGPSLHEFKFFSNFTPSFIHFLCASDTELCHVKIGNTANSPNKVTRHAVYTCCTVKDCNLPTEFTQHKKLGEYFIINRQYTKSFQSNQHTYTTLNLLEQCDEWIDVLGSRTKVVVHFYSYKRCIIGSVVVVQYVVQSQVCCLMYMYLCTINETMM